MICVNRLILCSPVIDVEKARKDDSMRLFYFLAKKICYTFALSIFTIILGWIVIFFSIFYGNSFFAFSYERILPFIITYIPIGVVASTVAHLLHFGLLSPLGIPAFISSHRTLNMAYKTDFEVSDKELMRVYGYFSDLPMHNLITATLYTLLGTMIIIGFAFYHYYISQVIDEEQIRMIIRIIPLTVMLVIIFYGMTTYLLTEALTNNERSMLYNMILRKGIKLRPRVLIGIRLKFVFFIMLMILTLLTFAGLMEKGRIQNEYNIEMIIIYFGMSIFAGFVLMQVTTRSILTIISDMIRVTKEISSGGRAGFKVLSLEHEFAAIEFALMEMAWEIDTYRSDLEGKVEQRTYELQDALSNLKGRDDLIQKQLDMASIIQRSILPGRIEDWNELKFSVRYVAMEKIGGDYYDVVQLKDNKIGILIADVSGHGIPAALVTTMAKISFGNAGVKYDSPRRIFQEVNQNILDHVKTQDYMTCFMVSVDDEYNVVYSNASHQKAILLRTEQNRLELLDTDGLFIGAIEDASDTYSEKIVKLNYGDRIILYTDGIPEALNEKREEYSNVKLERIAMENRHLPLEEFSDSLIRDVQNYIGRAPVVDDITLLVIELARDEAVDQIKNSKKLVDSHKYFDAIDILEKGLEKHRDNQKILYNLSKNYFRVNNFTKALEYIERYLAIDKRNKFAFYISGASYYQTMDYKKSVENFERALELDPNFINALFAMAMAYKKKGDKNDAIRTFEKVASIDPDNKMALFELRELSSEKK